jgi:glycine/sarcosine N-methyltransferase
MTVPLYDALAEDYDRFVNWEGRLAVEMPFLDRWLAAGRAQRVLDAACGTGRHALALAGQGYAVVGADVSAEMVARARQNAAAADQAVRFVAAGFGELAPAAGGAFDALLCLGNSLPHALTAAELAQTLADFAAVLRPGGRLLIQNRNFDAVLAGCERWMGPEAHREGEREWLFVRFYDFNADGTLTFNMLRLRRDGGSVWEQGVESTLLFPWTQAELTGALRAAGFGRLVFYGDMTGAPFDAAASGNLIVAAIRLPGEEG